MAIEPIKGFYVHDEVTDTDGVARYDAEQLAGDVLNGEAGSSAKFQIDGTKESIDYKNAFDGLYKQGFYSNINGSYNPNRTDYVCTVNPIPLDGVDVFKVIDFGIITEFYIAYFDGDGNFVNEQDKGAILTDEYRRYGLISTRKDRISAQSIPANASYCHISVKNANGLAPTTAPKITVLCKYIGSSDIENTKRSFSNNGLYYFNWQNCIYYYGDGVIRFDKNRIGIIETKTARDNLTISIDSGYKYVVFRFSSTDISTSTEISSTGWVTAPHEIQKGDIFLINISKRDGSVITPSDGSALKIEKTTAEIETNAYVVGSDLLKKSINYSRIGQLSYAQAFCKYDGKYYSIDGDNIAVQDSSFNVEQTTALSTGHGNSLQLGSNGKAYASGWNDNKVHVVDLETLSVDDVIELPATGYTTVAVDDINSIAYIFQRDTYPDTEAQYNFIVYDYANEQIKSTKKLTAFAAMQSCDFFEGKIIVLNGLGTTTAPNGYRVYNTNGDVLASYTLPDFDSQEPEGVCFDRDTETLMLSYLNKYVYSIE